MSRFGKFAIIVSVIWFIIFTAYESHRRSIILQLLGGAVAFFFVAAVVAAVICIFTDWRKRRWLSFLPLAVCVLSMVLSWELTGAIRQIIFDHSLPGYEAVVRQMKAGSIPLSTNWNSVPQAVSLAPLAYAVLAHKDTNGILAVEFLTEAGFPVMHSGYLYISSGVIKPGSTEDVQWPIKVQERPRWFYISD